ncbi:MAG: TetR/AcrR family transcriptional regulator [Eubacteriaceae bacterium]|jgi:AcrR family transcriptional regulator|nr:TetR/AcrR family transcriptional regulator [Eubacteriaceae bacterium]
MEMGKQDRRVRKTQAALNSALVRLLKETELKNVTVSKLAKTADVNRGTFYVHYRDVYDLFEQMENDALGEFAQIIQRYSDKEGVAWSQAIRDLFSFISENCDTLEAILNCRESTFLAKAVDISRPKSMQEWERLFGPGQSEAYYGYCYAYITSGSIALIKSWFLNGMKEGASEMAILTDRLTASCMPLI